MINKYLHKKGREQSELYYKAIRMYDQSIKKKTRTYILPCFIVSLDYCKFSLTPAAYWID